jgi:hypothetical protein
MTDIYYIVHLVCLIWVLYHVWAVNKSLSGAMKIVWSLVGLFLGILGAIIYYFVGKK